ncbi:MAG: ribosome biogenesis GTP-binding protein YihA/YsxC, partial [Bacteroidales bacterium]|nr:ribosome biogenesis GTP-binding protein YihA/YsxC [Bacteroidales bacterium]
MKINSAVFIKSSPKWNLCPQTNLPEYAFIGRSNVGKSSFINMITNHGKLAKTSSKPGKTQLINHFLINDSWYLVDLPGYGYAKIAKSVSAGFSKMISDYILYRPNLVAVCVLIDSRLKPQQNDLEFL